MKENIRSEEIHDIIERMPNKFGKTVTGFILLLFSIIITLGFVVDYPDVVTGTIQIRRGALPIKIITKTNGNIKLLISLKENLSVKQGDYLAYFENPTNVENIHTLKNILARFEVNNNYQFLNNSLKGTSLQFGELTAKVNQVQGITEKLLLFEKANVYRHQSYGAKNELVNQSNILKELELQINIRKRNLVLAKQMFTRDSLLFSKELISRLEYEKSNQTYLSYEESLFNLTKERLSLLQKSKDMTSQDTLANVQLSDKYQDIKMQFNYYLHDLTEGIVDWEQKYVIICPINGRLNVLKYVEENEFLRSGEELFAVMPEDTADMDGIIEVPTSGSGKIKKNQKVIIKLDELPYREFGTIEGKVKDIAKVSRTITDSKLQQNTAYLVTVSFPHQFRTSFGTTLNLKSGEKGMAEIITANRQLINRVFRSVKYSTNKY